MRAEERGEQVGGRAGPERGPATSLEQLEHQVAELCATLRPSPGPVPDPGQRLADLGLDSLACADLAVSLEERFGVRPADAGITEALTVREVAEAVRREAEAVRRELPGPPRVPEGLGRHQGVVKSLGEPIVRWYLRLEVQGEEHVPASGPAILAANHRSMWDIPVHVVATPRPVVFMAKQELFADPVRRWVWQALGGFPVRRQGADLGAIETALALLERGEVVGMYPEGTRSRSGRMLPFLEGAAWLALRTGAPIVPCATRGTERRAARGPGGRGWVLGRRRVRVRFGPPIEVDPEPDPRARREKAAALTARLRDTISELLEEAATLES